MYFTTFYSGEKEQFSIVHEFEPSPYADDLATYENYIIVKRKPTPEQAQSFQAVFEIVVPQNLHAGISSAKTVKL